VSSVLPPKKFLKLPAYEKKAAPGSAALGPQVSIAPACASKEAEFERRKAAQDRQIKLKNTACRIRKNPSVEHLFHVL
jgi:hypothetical protein